MTTLRPNGEPANVPAKAIPARMTPSETRKGAKDRLRIMWDYYYSSAQAVPMCTVIVRDMELDEDQRYTIVANSKAVDPFNNIISCESPLGVAIVGKTVGEVVKVRSPNGIHYVEILEIA